MAMRLGDHWRCGWLRKSDASVREVCLVAVDRSSGTSLGTTLTWDGRTYRVDDAQEADHDCRYLHLTRVDEAP
jgi:hypothetical protein